MDINILYPNIQMCDLSFRLILRVYDFVQLTYFNIMKITFGKIIDKIVFTVFNLLVKRAFNKIYKINYVLKNYRKNWDQLFFTIILYCKKVAGSLCTCLNVVITTIY